MKEWASWDLELVSQLSPPSPDRLLDRVSYI